MLDPLGVHSGDCFSSEHSSTSGLKNAQRGPWSVGQRLGPLLSDQMEGYKGPRGILCLIKS